MLSNLAPGVTESMLPGAHDRDVSFTIEVIIYGTCDLNDNDPTPTPTDQINERLEFVKQNYFGVTPNYASYTIIDHEPNEYINFSFEATIEGDCCIDMQYVDPEDDSDLIDTIRDHIYEELSNYNIFDDEVDMDMDQLEYEVH